MPGMLFIIIIRNKEEEETNHMNNTWEIARLPGKVSPGLGCNTFIPDLFE